MRLTIRAWRQGHYVGLAELLLVLGRFVYDQSWTMRVVEVAPGPGESFFDAWDPATVVSTYELLHLVTPAVQLIDGSVSSVSCDSEGEPWLTLRAVDSTTWDIETRDLGVIRAATSHYALGELDES